MAKIIGIVQLKGGTGRSTVATNIAGGLSHVKKGKQKQPAKVLLIDCDMPQGTSACWYAIRDELGKTGSLDLETASSHTELLTLIEKLDSDYDFICIDTPPRVAEITNSVLIIADLLIIPCSTTTADLWATQDLLETINEAENERQDLTARLLWNKHRAHIKSTDDTTKAAKKDLPIKAMKSTLGLRVAYAEGLGEGLTGLEVKDRNTRLETVELIKEVIKLTR